MIDALRACTRALVQRYGCLDAAAETINARLASCTSKGTLSKKMGGQLDFTLAEIVALEDALDAYPVTRMLARRLAAGAGSMGPGGLVGQGGLIAREAGEAVAALLSAGQSGRAADRAAAAVELAEVIEAAQAALTDLEGGAV